MKPIETTEISLREANNIWCQPAKDVIPFGRVDRRNPRYATVGFLFSAFLSAFLLWGGGGLRAEEAGAHGTAVISSETDLSMAGALSKVVHGEISISNSSGLALVYEKDPVKHSEKEMWFPMEGKVFLTGYESMSDISAGDKVMVSYDESRDGRKKVIKGISLVKKAEPAPSDEKEKTSEK